MSRTPLGKITVLPRLLCCIGGGEEKGKAWKGREDRKAEEREEHREEVRGGEKERGQGRRGRSGAPLFGSSLCP